MSAFVRQHGGPCAFASDQSWVILSPIEQSIKAKIERIGTPLKDWDVQIYRGILTGCNEAFIIGEERRKEILSWCTSETERTRTDGIIRPILRGRDIKRYGYDWANLYILALFPARHYDIEDYPALKRHLLSYAKDALIEGGRPDLAQEPFLSHFCRAKLEQSGQPVRIGGQTVSLRKRDGSTEPQKARKRTANKWFETQDAIAYWDDFSKPKIVWGNLCLHSSFAKAPGGMFANAPSPMLVPYTDYLLAVLNSKLGDWYIRQLGVTRNGGYFEYKPMFVEQLPVPQLDAKEQKAFFSFLPPGASLQDVQDAIDENVFKLYGLSSQERDFILNND
jgi:hypothetical protein